MKINGFSPSNDVAAMRHDLFTAVDTNGDAGISKSELGSFLSSLPGPGKGTGAGLDAFFARLDVDGSGSVSEDEQNAFLESLASRVPQALPPMPDPAKLAEKVFKKVDGDNDGLLRKTDLQSALKGHGSELVDQLFTAADRDGDGAISQSELQSWIAEQLPPPLGYDREGTTRGEAPGASFSTQA